PQIGWSDFHGQKKPTPFRMLQIVWSDFHACTITAHKSNGPICDPHPLQEIGPSDFPPSDDRRHTLVKHH
ncbi:hypothetical protein HN873_005086, partial [Arachis hypogaea]